jgi:flavin reductase (DIM6/NTAB) family NADH-FMN oxidoreductase RutF
LTPDGMSDAYFYEPSQGHGLRHDPLNAIVAPRPIGWISSRGTDGQLNLAPYSFFNLFCYRPPIVGFASTGWKDSVRNARETGEFCWSLATRPLAEPMNATSAAVAPDVDEFALAGLTPTASRVVSVPHVAESPVSFECRVTQIVQLHGADGAVAQSWLTLGEVVGVHIAAELVATGIYDTVAARPIVRGGGPTEYFEITDAARFHMTRPSGRT